MALTNVQTDQLDIVRIEEAKGLFRLFSRTLSSSDGFCLVVFRKESYIGSISSEGVVTESDLRRKYDRIGVRDGDSILRINMGPRPMTISERLTTQDGYTRAYKLEIEIHVSDARNFAQRYRQASDPINMARLAIEGALQRCATRNIHDELSEEMLLNCTLQALTSGSNRSFGLGVTAAHKITLWMDPIRVKELEIIQKGHLEEQRIREEARVKQIEVQEGTEVRKEEVRGNADVGRLQMEFDQEFQATVADFERSEEQKRREHEMSQEMYLLRERSKQRKVTRVDEVDEKDHQMELEGKQDDYLRLKAGQDSALRREEEMREDEHIARQNYFKIEQASKQRKLVRVEEVEEQRHALIRDAMLKAAQRQQDLLGNISEKAIDALSERISDRIDGGEKLSTVLSEVLGDYPELRDIFLSPDQPGSGFGERGSLRVEEATKIPTALPPEAKSQESSKGQGNASSPDPLPEDREQNVSSSTEDHVSSIPEHTQDTSSLPGILRQQDSAINITDLGITLLQIELAENQRLIASTSTSIAFVISALTDQGPAKRAALAIDDIVVEMNGQELENSQVISGILKSYRPGITVSFCILRGEELMTVDVQSMR
jgi:PDZ domain